MTIQENGKLTPCSKESIRGMMKYIHQQLLRIIEKHNHPREWQTHILLKRIHPGNYEIYTSAAAANNRKHNDPREWETHALLKRTNRGNDEIYTSAAATNNRKHNDPKE